MSATHKTPAPRQPIHTAADFGAHERRILVLQGGGGRGAYQAGVYEGAAAAGFAPDWIVGISIGAINAALIAGNPPQRRLERLREFWHRVSAQASFVVPAGMDFARPVINRMAAASAMRFGIPGFFAPRVPAPQYAPDGTLAALSYYDTEPLHATLDELVDFDLINGGEVRLSLGAVDARSGESVYFDSTTHTITASHVMASSALPPGFPPVEIDGEYYFDGAIMSDTPVQYVAQNFRIDALIVQVDLFSGMGELPRNLDQVRERVKDIRSENKARLSQDRIRQVEALRSTLAELLARLPAGVRADPKLKRFEEISRRSPMSLIRLVNRGDAKSSDFTDYEFSRATVDELWQAGNADIRHVLRHPEACRVTDLGNGARAFEPWPRDNKGIAA